LSFFKTIRKHVFRALPKPLRSFELRIIGKRDLTLRNLNKLLKLSNYGYRATYVDSFNLITRMGVGFLDSEQFLSADLRARQVTGQIRSLWTTHVLLWAAECGARLPGDFVECGVEKGFGAHAIVNHLNFPQLQDKTFYLLDSWEGGDMKNLAAEEQVWANPKWNEQFTGFYDEVKKSFDEFKNVTLIKGFLPGSLNKHS
jgi:hypothetical protein